MVRGIRTHDLTRLRLKSYPQDLYYHKKLKFSAQKNRKTRDFEKNHYPKYGKK